jgi:hypothetical protein
LRISRCLRIIGFTLQQHCHSDVLTNSWKKLFPASDFNRLLVSEAKLVFFGGMSILVIADMGICQTNILASNGKATLVQLPDFISVTILRLIFRLSKNIKHQTRQNKNVAKTHLSIPGLSAFVIKANINPSGITK